MKKIKVLADLLPIPSFAGIIICFFLPFMAVKCGDTTIISLSGMDLVRGIDMKEKVESSEFGKKMKDPFGTGKTTSLWGNDEEEEEDYNYEDEYESYADDEEVEDSVFNDEKEDLVNIIPGTNDKADTPEAPKSEKMWFLFIPLLLALIGLVISFMKFATKQTVILVISFLGLLSMSYFGISLKYANGMPELKELQGGMDIIKINLEIGFYLATLLFLVSPILFSIKIFLERLQAEEAVTPAPAAPAPQPDESE